MTNEAANHMHQIINLIEQRAGLLLREPHRENDARRAITSTINKLGFQDAEGLYYQLQQNDTQTSLWQTLLHILTVGETYFFRNQAHFRALREEILPQMIARKRERNQHWLRIWSAGCATGEEIYSIAILIRELLPDYPDWSLYFIGTDLNDTYLEQARQGVYRINSFRSETPETLQEEWFTKHDNHYKLSPTIRNMVLFQHLNLVTGKYPSQDSGLRSMDLILCQNVTIYFDRPTTEHVQTQLVETLAEDAWLILGHSEPLYIKSPYLALRNFPNAVVFQRQPAVLQPKHDFTPLPPKAVLPPPPKMLPSVPPKAPTPTAKLTLDLCQQAQEAADRQAWNEALTFLDQLAAVQRLSEYPYYLRALIYIEKSELPKALEALRQALYCNPQFILAHYTLGGVYQRLGQTSLAKREWQVTDKLLSGLTPDSLVPHGGDLTIEMLRGLLAIQQGREE